MRKKYLHLNNDPMTSREGELSPDALARAELMDRYDAAHLALTGERSGVHWIIGTFWVGSTPLSFEALRRAADRLEAKQ